MPQKDNGTWDYFYRHSDASERDIVAEAKRLEWCGDTPEQIAVVAVATEILRKYGLL